MTANIFLFAFYLYKKNYVFLLPRKRQFSEGYEANIPALT